MARKTKSPVLNPHITRERYEKAVKSNSGACLIADSIKDDYPHLSYVSVDMATIRVTDRKAGYRYTYLTPPLAQKVLLDYDQGWDNQISELVIKGAVTITPIIRAKNGKNSPASIKQRRQERISELEAKDSLTQQERAALTRLKNPTPSPERPTTTGTREVKIVRGGVVVQGGRPIPQGQAHPNLLRGTNRHFGARMADPGEVFEAAVQAEVGRRLREQEDGGIKVRRIRRPDKQ